MPERAPLRLVETRRRSKKRPHEMSARSGAYTMTIPVDRLEDWIRLARIALESTGEPFSIEAAVVDVMLVSDKTGTLPKQSDCQDRWGWSRSQVRTRWNDLIELAAAWRSSFGRNGAASCNPENGRQNVAIESPSNRHESGDSGTKSKGNRQAIAIESPSGHPDTLYGDNSQLSTDSLSAESNRRKRPDPELAAAVERIWQAYPRKSDKKKTIPKIEALLRSGRKPEHFETLEDAVAEYARSRQGEPSKFTMGAYRFFGPAERFDDDPSAWWGGRSNSAETIGYREWCALPERDRRHRPVTRIETGELRYIENGAPLPSGYREGGP